jgi:hypothetical protein
MYVLCQTLNLNPPTYGEHLNRARLARIIGGYWVWGMGSAYYIMHNT